MRKPETSEDAGGGLSSFRFAAEGLGMSEDGRLAIGLTAARLCYGTGTIVV